MLFVCLRFNDQSLSSSFGNRTPQYIPQIVCDRRDNDKLVDTLAYYCIMPTYIRFILVARSEYVEIPDSG
jgi:hypothetical protein